MMGEVAEMMLDGTLCEGCGVFLNQEGLGYPCLCSECGAESKAEKKTANVRAHLERQAAQKKVSCTICGRRVKTVGLADHVRDSHPASKQPAAEPAHPLAQYKPAFEQWATQNGTYHLAPGTWRMISNGGVPVEDHFRPYRQDRTMHTFEGFVAGLEAGRTDLSGELRKADRIINVMLNAMTLEQKSKCAAQLESEGVSPDGMTRAHERAAVLAAAGTA